MLSHHHIEVPAVPYIDSLLLGDIEEDDWMDDMIQILQKISRPEYRELAKKQIELLIQLGDN